MNKNIWRIMMTYVLSLILPIGIILIVIVSHTTSNLIEDLTSQMVDEELHDTSERITGHIDALVDILKMISVSEDIKSMDWDRQLRYIRSIEALSEDFIIQVSDIHGVTRVANGSIFDLSEKENFLETISNEDIFITDPLYSEVDGKPIIVISLPIYDLKDNLSGMVAIVYNLDVFNDIIQEISTDEFQSTIVFSNEGQIISKPKSIEMSDVMAKIEQYNNNLGNEFDNIYISRTKIESIDWHIVILKSFEADILRVKKMETYLILTIIVVVLLLLFMSTLLYKKMMKHLLDFIQSIQKIADGNYVHKLKRSRIHEMQIVVEAVNSMSSKIKKRENELKDFVYIASHDFKEPVRMVKSYMEIIKTQYGDTLDERGNKFIGYAYEGAERIGGLIDSMLVLSRAGGEYDKSQKVLLKEIILKSLQPLRLRVDEKKATIILDDLEYYIRGNTLKLSQVFYNLIENALKYSEEGVRIKIWATSVDQAVTIRVEDNGIGMRDESREVIFKVFKRLHRSEYPGTGIGLALCKKIIEDHHGNISVESVIGEGSTFIIEFPLLDDLS